MQAPQSLLRSLAIATQTALLLLCVSNNAYALDMVQEVQQCAEVNDDAARLQCFDALSASLVQAQASGTEVEQALVAQESKKEDGSAATMPEALGGSRFASEESKAGPLADGKVSFCQRAYDKKWLFVFANGQVWKQTDGRNYRFSECNFDVVIDKDFFGYFMQIQGDAAGKTGKVRIGRLK